MHPEISRAREFKVEGTMDAKLIPIVVITGSVRPHNYTRMAADLVMDEFRRNPKVSVELIDPGTLNLPFPGFDPDADGPKLLRAKVSGATGVVLATPEYHGSFSSMMKLVIENLGFPSVLAGKPIALLGVAAGSIGAIKALEQLRSVVSHIGGIPLPLPTSIANVQKVFDKEGHSQDPAIEKQIRSTATNLLNYIHQNICPRIALERILREGPGAVQASDADALIRKS
jgi:chromate reductase